jgi:hypothetical protein
MIIVLVQAYIRPDGWSARCLLAFVRKPSPKDVKFRLDALQITSDHFDRQIGNHDNPINAHFAINWQFMSFFVDMLHTKAWILPGISQIITQDKRSPYRSVSSCLFAMNDSLIDILWVSIFSSELSYEREQIYILFRNPWDVGHEVSLAEGAENEILNSRWTTEPPEREFHNLTDGSTILILDLTCRRKSTEIRKFHVKAYSFLTRISK